MASALLAALGGLIAGASVAGGVLAGGAMAVLSFRWLVVRAALITMTSGAPVSAWVIGAGVRFAACMVVCAVLLKTGWADPIALVVGFTVLPCDVVVRGLTSVRGGA